MRERVLEKLLDGLYANQGNLQKFLESQSKSRDEQSALLFDILYQLNDPKNYHHKQEWDTLLDVGLQMATMQVEAQLLKRAMDGEIKDAELKQILERLAPDKWARKSVNKAKEVESASVIDAVVQGYQAK